MKSKIISIILTLAMLVLALTVCVNADSDILQICTDVIEINGVGHASTNQLTAEAWFAQNYDGVVEDTDGTIATFRVRGWVNPLDDSKVQQYGYSLLDENIIWDDSFMAENAGLSGYFANAERFDLTIDLTTVPVGTYQFQLYIKTSSGEYPVDNETFTFKKLAETKTPETTAEIDEGTSAEATIETTAEASVETTVCECVVTTVEIADETTVAETETVAETVTETEAATTAAVTTAAETVTTVSETTTQATESKSGCGSVISVSAIALVALFGGAIVFNKRR